MALFKLPDATTALHALLETEREMLLTGQIQELVGLAPEKERLISQLADSKEGFVQLGKLRTLADRNQELLVAVSKGIRSVSRRLEALRTQRSQLRTYGSDGQSQNLERQKSSFEKRA